MNCIVVVAANQAIGKENKLLFSLPEDMKHFRSHTLGKTVVMGRKTLESFPGAKPLPKRTNICLLYTSRHGKHRDQPGNFKGRTDIPVNDVNHQYNA